MLRLDPAPLFSQCLAGSSSPAVSRGRSPQSASLAGGREGRQGVVWCCEVKEGQYLTGHLLPMAFPILAGFCGRFLTHCRQEVLWQG